MEIAKFLFAKVWPALVVCFSTSAMAGPIIIAGTDADDHGFESAGVNRTGWAFMQKAFENIGGAVTNGNKIIVCIGCNGSRASDAYHAATARSALAGTWSFVSLSSDTDIANFFNGTGSRNVSNTGIIYMPTVDGNVVGGITDDQLAIANANGSALNNFVAGGGGLFTQEQVSSTIGYGWLSSLSPGFTVKGDGAGGVRDSNAIRLTADGTAAFRGLTDTDLSNATPWHAYFENYGSLKALGVGNGDGIGGYNDAVIIGGGAGTILACGMAGQPACGVPEPAPLPLLAVGAIGFLAWRRKRAR